MLRNYLKLALRNIWRHKGTASLNVAGLTLGLAAGLLMLMWVNDEKSYDQFHEKGAQIFKVNSLMDEGNGEIDVWTTSPEPWMDLVMDNIPDVKEATTFAFWNHRLEIGQQKYEEAGCYASPGLFDMFSFDLLYGDLGKVLEDPNSIAISATLAAKMFGVNWRKEGRTIGQSIVVEEKPVQVTAVFADVPFQSTLQFSYVLPMSHYLNARPWTRGSWGNYNFDLYVELVPGADQEAVANKMYSLIKDNTKGGSPDHGILLHSISDLYLYSKYENGKVAGGRIDYVRIFFWASILVLLIACINYMNLVTARSSQRAKEVGVRKVVGANKERLLTQFVIESVVMTFIAGAITLIVAQVFLPVFNELTGKSMEMGFGSWSFWSLFGGILLSVALIAGSYPSFLLSSFDVIQVLKSKKSKLNGGISFRRVMVVMQFGLSILLLIGAIVVREQIGFFKSKDLGFNRENVILYNMYRLGEEGVGKKEVIKSELLQLPEIAEVTAANYNPLSIANMTGDPEWEGFEEGDEGIFSILTIDHKFLDMMKIPVVMGENFQEGMPTDSLNFNYIINEEAAKTMGFDDPVGKKLSFWDDQGRIVGMVKSFHFSSLHNPIKPLILRYEPDRAHNLLIKPTNGKTKECLAALEALQTRLSPDREFKYTFLDQHYEKLYQAEERTSDLADLFAIIALLISTLGLFGLAAFMAEQRTKEIGIRKVLGASMGNILYLLNKELGQLILLAFLIATPLAWWLMNNWLEKFAYHMNIGWQVVAAAGLILAIVALLTVSFHSIRTALSNPVDALRYE
ncbi:MAG: ABC transporter permease [Saprospiraceae bacterium]|nr:ABC transporter permease [Saprospiraceae bacterium]